MKKTDAYNTFLRSNYLAYCLEALNEGCDLNDESTLRWKPTNLHKFLCMKVQTFIEEKTGNPYDVLCISVPPQHGKSLTITETLVSWYLGNNPEKRVIEVSYNQDFAKRFGKRNKEKIVRLGGLFGISLASDTKSNDTWELSNHVGGMISRGITSGITGQPGDLIIIDDPIKNREEADSKTTRDKIWAEWVNSVKTRLSAGAKVIVIQTRWHEDDLYGRLEKNDPFTRTINLPLEAEDNDPLGRKQGESLCPEIGKDDTWLKGFKESFLRGDIDEGGESGRRAWEALMQGHPTALEGNMFKRSWWKYYSYSDYVEKRLPMDFVVISVDAAFKDKENSDYVAIECWGKSGMNMYLLDMIHDRLSFTDTCRAIAGMTAHYPQATAVWIEDKANGTAIIDLMRNMIPVGLVGIEPNGGKESRAAAVTGYVEGGKVFLPRDRNFVGDFIDEFAEFPNGKHDDMVDSCFAAGTKIATPFGDRNIENIKVGDRVITPFGIRKVTKAGCTGEKEVITKFGMTVTPNHKFFTKKYGYVSVDSIAQSVVCDKISFRDMMFWNTKKQLCSTVLNTDLWGAEGITFLNQLQMKGVDTLKDFMSQFGNTTTKKPFRMAMSFITKTAIHSITTLAIWSAYRIANIVKSIRKCTIRMKKHSLSISKKSDRLQKHGTVAKKGSNGIKTIGKNLSVNDMIKNTSTHAESAERTQEKLVRENVQVNSHEKVKVYNIEVEKDHLYYAGGFLVHNCTQCIVRLGKMRFYKGKSLPERSWFDDFREKPKRIGIGERIHYV